jgi:hypothetical protein
VSGWLVVPIGDDEVHVVPAVDVPDGHVPDPEHEPSSDCLCRPRIGLEPRDDPRLPSGRIIIHNGPN